jgi:hypothetical protein
MISGNTTITVNAQNCNSGGGNPTCGVGAQAYTDSLNTNIAYFMAFPNGVAPYTYSWLFSDGSTSALQNPTVTFTNGGLNWGNVTVTDANGCVSSFSASVQTAPPAPSCFSMAISVIQVLQMQLMLGILVMVQHQHKPILNTLMLLLDITMHV